MRCLRWKKKDSFIVMWHSQILIWTFKYKIIIYESSRSDFVSCTTKKWGKNDSVLLINIKYWNRKSIKYYLCHHCFFKFSICLHQSGFQGGAGERSGVFSGHWGNRRLPPGASDGPGRPRARTATGCRIASLPQAAGRQRGRRPQQEPADPRVQRRLQRILPAHPQRQSQQTGRLVAR